MALFWPILYNVAAVGAVQVVCCDGKHRDTMGKRQLTLGVSRPYRDVGLPVVSGTGVKRIRLRGLLQVLMV